ncbi:transcriptional pleiotropic regulator of transition state genes [Paenibacillus mucilaginosus]|uniref:AbrB/MazE/SpoVT family DNA-binding domain-containing protein n=1 Tax=Paenibacillus mucilaginosus TaxID=61624 RepID=UPI003D22C0ED
MKRTTGIVREMDALGRVVIPKEARDLLKIAPADSLEIFIDGTNQIILRKYTSTVSCMFCSSTEGIKMFKEKLVCSECWWEAIGGRPVEEPPAPEDKPAKTNRLNKEAQLARLAKVLRENPGSNQKRIAEIMGLSQGRISQLMKEIQQQACKIFAR